MDGGRGRIALTPANIVIIVMVPIIGFAFLKVTASTLKKRGGAVGEVGTALNVLIKEG